jgi:2-keto-4-pentenoate hydratase
MCQTRKHLSQQENDVDSPSLTADFFAELRAARRTEDNIPTELRPQDMASAYAIQEALVARLLARHGGQAIGYKIACTNPSAQKLLNMHAPVYGRLLSAFVYPSPARLRASDFTIRCIEAEFAFEIARDVPAADIPYTTETIAVYVGRALPAIEIVDHRLADWSRFDALSLIADNAIHGAWIPGAAGDAWQTLDLATHTVRLLVNHTVIRTGRGDAVLGHPLHALAWLANELPKQGRALQAGEFVTTGVCTDIYLAQAGDVLQADFGALGSVELVFD